MLSFTSQNVLVPPPPPAETFCSATGKPPNPPSLRHFGLTPRVPVLTATTKVTSTIIKCIAFPTHHHHHSFLLPSPIPPDSPSPFFKLPHRNHHHHHYYRHRYYISTLFCRASINFVATIPDLLDPPSLFLASVLLKRNLPRTFSLTLAPYFPLQ